MDAGQGDCTLILFPDGATNWLIDCGSNKNGKIAVKGILTRLTAELKKRSQPNIKRLILTHPDEDHYNLLSSVFNTIKPDEIVYGGHIDQYQNKKDKNFTYDMLKAYGAKAISPDKFADWEAGTKIGGCSVTFLAANATGKWDDTNNNSIVVLLEYNGYKYFLMGDAETSTETFIYKTWNATGRLAKGSVGTVLKMGHHGSDTSSSETWVKALTPTALVVSADTRVFGINGKGMPTGSHIQAVSGWASATIATNIVKHTYVVFDDLSPPQAPTYRKPLQSAATQTAICTTLYGITHNATYSTFAATGGSWYYRMASDGLHVEWSGDPED